MWSKMLFIASHHLGAMLKQDQWNGGCIWSCARPFIPTSAIGLSTCNTQTTPPVDGNAYKSAPVNAIGAKVATRLFVGWYYFGQSRSRNLRHPHGSVPSRAGDRLNVRLEEVRGARLARGET